VLVGYARVSTQEQDLSLQLDALRSAGCSKLFEEKASGAQRERPALQAALAYMRTGDTLVVWKLDRLARSLKQLIETVCHNQDVIAAAQGCVVAIEVMTRLARIGPILESGRQ
jgi:DNA invertase Pin-like site-specific DNA recombinase